MVVCGHHSFAGARAGGHNQHGETHTAKLAINEVRKRFRSCGNCATLAVAGVAAAAAGLRQRDAAARGGDPLVLFGRRAA